MKKTILEPIKNGLIGSLEMFLLMPHSGRWFAPDRRSALISFIIPVLMIFYATWGTYIDVFSDLEWFKGLICYGLVLSGFKLFLFLWMVKMIAKAAGNMEHYWRFVHANNWVIFISCICLTPAGYVLSTTYGPDTTLSAETTFPYVLCGLFYSYLIMSVSAVRILQLTWEQSILVNVSSIIANGILYVPFQRIGGLIIV